MTRKVTAYCFRKRLLLLPYTNKLFSTQPHYTPLYWNNKDINRVNNETRCIIPYVQYSGTNCTLCTIYASTFLAAPQSKKGDVVISISRLLAVPELCSILMGNDVSSNV